jgi:hypothetical protein
MAATHLDQMQRALITDLHKVAPQRKAGFLEACLKTGTLSADKMWVSWPDDVHQQLRNEYNPGALAAAKSGHVASATSQPKSGGFGTMLSKVATPIARTLGLDCVDKTTGNLRPESKCAQRRDAMDAATPAIFKSNP